MRCAGGAGPVRSFVSSLISAIVLVRTKVGLITSHVNFRAAVGPASSPALSQLHTRLVAIDEDHAPELKCGADRGEGVRRRNPAPVLEVRDRVGRCDTPARKLRLIHVEKGA